MERRWWTLLVVCASMFMLLLDVNVIVIALPDIQRSLHAGFGQVQWMTDAYALTLAALLLTAGSLADRYGRRTVFVTGLAVFTGGSLLCGLAQSAPALILFRAVQGAGAAILSATSLALLAASFQGRQRGVAFGVWGAVAGVATGLGPVLGGVVTGGIGWRWIFLLNVPVGVAAIVISLCRVEGSRSARGGRVDRLGVTTLTAGLFSLVYALITATESGWGERSVLGLLGLAALCLAAFAVVERRVREPMFSLPLLRIPAFLGGSVAAVAMNASLYAAFLYLVFYLQNGLGGGPLVTGVRLLAGSAFTFVAAVFAGRLSSRVPVRWLIGPGLCLVGGGLLLMRGVTPGSDWTHLVPGLIVSGIGAGMVNPPLASTAVGVVPLQRSGMASGANQTFRQIGMAVGIAWYGTVFSASLHAALQHRLAGVPALSGQVDGIADAVHRGVQDRAVAAAAPELRGRLTEAIRAGFADSLNDVLLAAALVALVGGVLATVLIRERDFAAHRPSTPAEPEESAEPSQPSQPSGADVSGGR
ncbi:MFS transporter [Streptomyces sp. HNM0575]|uniref:MFS transporter n=1 Tax=Streptomyces sp. HNM0575 TaxID=2716338 RepID=UPI00145EAE0A|nr:MFS transporter [Streptomyces sp. HNM0575]NLU73979.1 MFS transporter [Streptomyces sp. HNM0575]